MEPAYFWARMKMIPSGGIRGCSSVKAGGQWQDCTAHTRVVKHLANLY